MANFLKQDKYGVRLNHRNFLKVAMEILMCLKTDFTSMRFGEFESQVLINEAIHN